MRLMARIGLLTVCLLAASVSAVLAQATGQITGVVTDGSGAVLPGVTVEATNAGTGAVRTAVTGSDGLYTLPLLQPGVYTVRATLEGFRVGQQDGVRVTVTETARAVFQLEVGQVSETVTVTAAATLVETSNATHGIVIDQQKVVDLPLNGRNFTQLGTLIPGVVAPPTGLGGQNGDATPGGFGNATGGFNVNGMRNQSNNFLMDGATNNDTFNTGFVLRPPPDAIEEFKILTHAFGAEFGRNAGAVVNVVTKSGSNKLAGAAWNFNRDDALQARNFFAPGNQPKPVLKQNQFGGAFGGPVVKNKLFGFGYYEGYRNESGTTTNILVLSEAQRAGNFGTTTIRDPLTGLANRYALEARLDQLVADARRHDRRLAVLFLDMDNFKGINDSMGHGVGDEFLRVTAHRLRSAVRENDIVARLGGDEFVVVLSDMGEPQHALSTATKLLETLSQPVTLAGQELSPSASIGICF